MKPGKCEAVGSGGDWGSLERKPLSHSQLKIAVAIRKYGPSGAGLSDFQEKILACLFLKSGGIYIFMHLQVFI